MQLEKGTLFTALLSSISHFPVSCPLFSPPAGHRHTDSGGEWEAQNMGRSEVSLTRDITPKKRRIHVEHLQDRWSQQGDHRDMAIEHLELVS